MNLESRLQDALCSQQPVYWRNRHEGVADSVLFDAQQISAAAVRLQRFAPYIAKVFPATQPQQGLIESPLSAIPTMQQRLGQCTGRLYLKRDSDLPISGSIKARGGIHEVLKHAEQLALAHGRLSLDDDYACLADAEWRRFFSQHSIAVGSTGNLGLSIGIISAKLGFEVSVHMSADAKQWKKDLLRGHGARVIEYADDYQAAVSAGRASAALDSRCHFVDDEQSQDLFSGYAVAAARLAQQLQQAQIEVSLQQPLYVYLPCGVGGAPAGVAYGLKQVFADAVRPVLVEPTAAPCLLLLIASGLHEHVAVSDIGLDGKTIADGLAVGRASGLASRLMTPRAHALATVSDAQLWVYLQQLWQSESLFVEPSAAAGFAGYQLQMQQADTPNNAIHIVWATGGAMVPAAERAAYLTQPTSTP